MSDTSTRPEWATVALVADLRRVRGDLALAGKWASVRAVEEAIKRIEEADRGSRS